MSNFDSEDNFGNPWVAIVIGLGCFAIAWYIHTKMGIDPDLRGKAAIANSGIGRKLLVGGSAIVGAFFFIGGFKRLRSG